MGSGYQGEPSRPTLNDLSYRDLPRPPGIVAVLGFRQVTSSNGEMRFRGQRFSLRIRFKNKTIRMNKRLKTITKRLLELTLFL